MADETTGFDAASAASLQGPANQVMESIFNLVGKEEADEVESTDPAGGEETTPTPQGTQAPADPVVSEPADARVAGGEDSEPAPSGPSEPVRAVVTSEDQRYVDNFTEASEALEERFMDYYKQDVVARTEEVYGHYTQLLELHAMELVGKALPPIDGSDERFVPSSVQEAQQYQEAVNSMLVRQMRGEIEAMRQADDEVISVVHDSITLFQNNPDLIPNSKSFNKPLADHVMKLVQPYALRLDGKLTGFSIDIQGIIDQARGQFKAAPPAPTKKAATGRTTAPRPQGGLASKAGTSGAGDEDFTPMWNALGIDNMPV